jgi:DNA-binding IclR family transcriptional regulator
VEHDSYSENKNDSVKESKTKINSVIKALSILDLIAKNPMGLQIKEISFSLNLNLSTTYHLVNTLLEMGYLQKVSDSNYLIGYRIPALNNAFMQSINPDSSLVSFLHELSSLIHETTYLGKEQNGEIIIQSTVEYPHALKVNALHIGYKEHPHARALPKAIMAFWDTSKIKSYFKNREFVRITESTPGSLDELLYQLEKIRSTGYCIDEEGFSKGICCIAAPVFDVEGLPVAAFGTSMPSERFRDRQDELIDHVRTVAIRASRSLGYYGDVPEMVLK